MVISQESLESAAKEQLLTRFGNLALDVSEGCEQSCVKTNFSGFNRLKISAIGHEYSDLLLLTKTEHEGAQKIILVFVSLCEELVSLAKEARKDFLFQLLLFGEGQDESGELDDTTNEQVSSFLVVLLKLQAYVRRCRVVIEQTVRQIESFHTCTTLGLESKGVHLKPVFEKLSDLLCALATLDIACQNNEVLRDGVESFEKSLRTANHDPEQFGVTREDLGNLATVVSTLRKELLTGNLFQNAINVSVTSNIVVSEIITNIKGRLSSLEGRNPKDDPAEDAEEVMKIVCLHALSFPLGNAVEKKLATQLWDTRKKVPVVPVPCNNLWRVSEHMLKHVPGIQKIFDAKQAKSVENDVVTFVQQKDAEVAKELPAWEAKVSSWNSRFEEACTVLNPSIDELRQMADLLETGMKTASTLRHTAQLVLSLHSHFMPAMNKGLVLAVFRYVELADWTILSLERKYLSIVKTLSASLEHLAYSAMSILLQVQKRVKDDKKIKDKQQVYSALLSLACRSLNGPITAERRLIARLSLACACSTSASALSTEEKSTVGDILKKLELYSTFEDKLKQTNDFSFLFWNRTMLPVCLVDFYNKKKGVDFLNVIVKRFSDILQHCYGSDTNSSKIQTYLLKEITDNITSVVLEPLCRDIELELRLSTHTHLGGTEKSIFKEGTPDFNAILNAGPIRIGDRIISASEYVTNYLDKTFYNLTAVASHDWKTYMEMRVLAKKRFQLYTLDDRLPIQRLEQGLDVLEIIRNINVFATHYVYDLYSQSFIERQSDGKFLTTISIRHIANSIRTHGSGIISSAVNHTYHFLRQKFHIFSQFLYDDQIKSRLIKDLKMTRELRSQAAGQEAAQKFTVVYPYEKAEKFVRGIKNLGVTVDGRSYLDEYRLLITEVGNVMGYVRMLRSGNLHCCASTSDVLPSLSQPLSTLSSTLSACSFSGETVEAAFELERVLQNVTKNFEGGSDFLKLLVQAFASAFRDQKHSHLKLFYLIIPPLTISFVENIRNGKERLLRKDKQNSFFTDDGFVMGLAYILALLDQGAEFDSLHWFETVSQRYTNALVDIRHQQAMSARSSSSKKGEDGEKLKQTLSLTIRRLEAYRQEFELLEYSLVSARALFRSSLSNIPYTEKDDNKSLHSVGTSPSVCENPPVIKNIFSESLSS